ncbi:hypothetical protein CC77DRAFT_1062170 [Alternaria alternata]|uniref:Uncharacterized protein n=1 Tax=Alternaria alternata TaxID=5599 RepID=A0A177DIT4_ALTAL|nr:hypothetical protein CC77DRAFT_1062170 [Alternaria alternata]OAG19834.1 hypothetical protein CC77DRAFT_1062170 [Alternaria alternata]
MTVTIANLAQLRKELGVEGQALLDYAPHSKIRYAPQTHDQRAVPFKLLFGQITDKHDDSNISATITTIAGAFKTPKRGSKNKYIALAKYYFLNIIISRWTEQERQYDLAIPIPITRSLIDALKTACREFEAEAKANLSDTQSRSQSATLVDDDEDSVLSDAPEDPFEPAQPITPATVPASTYSASASQLVEDRTKLQDEEVELRDSQSKIVAEIAETKLALQEIGETLQEDEEKNRVIEEKLIKIAARREQLLEGMSAMEAYKLGGEMMKKR